MNGEWIVDNGELRMNSEELIVESGKVKVES